MDMGFGLERFYKMAETSKFRGLILGVIDKLTNYVSLYDLDILDIGSGDDPLNGLCDKFDLPDPYTRNCKVSELTYKGDARDIDKIVSKKYDVVYSSHLLEDFARTDTIPILEKWTTLLKTNGIIVLLLPDQQRYEAACKSKNEIPNIHHQITDFSLKYINDCFLHIHYMQVVFSKELFDDGEYNFLIVAKKI